MELNSGCCYKKQMVSNMRRVVLELPITENFKGHIDIRIGFDKGRVTGMPRILNAQILLDMPKENEYITEKSISYVPYKSEAK